ncbi:HC-toxin efflux carrier TOXA 15 [Seiridium cupressi]
MAPNASDGPAATTSQPGSNTTTLNEAEPGGTGDNTTVGTGKGDGIVYPQGIKLALILGSSYLAMFLVALVRNLHFCYLPAGRLDPVSYGLALSEVHKPLPGDGRELGAISRMNSKTNNLDLETQDRLIVTTAIPKISDDFHSVTNVGWYGSAYLLANCAFQLFFGKLFVVYSIKYVFLVSILLFEVGSALCGAAPNSIAFIVGRAIAGVGSAGIFSASITVMVYSVPLHRRPLYQGLFGVVFGVANVISPLLGGAFADSAATWRWCFYINLPLGAFSVVCIVFLLHIPDRPTQLVPTREKLAQLDSLGLITLLGGVISLLLALEWGGTTYAWNNGRIIALLVTGIALLMAFVAVQIIWPDTATVPPRVFAQRSIMTASLAMFTAGACMMTTYYYLPIWFQAIEGVSAVQSGIRLLPTVIGQALGSIAGGYAIKKIGYYTPVMLFSIALMCIGTGLLTTLQVDTSEGKWIGYQIPYGIGLGTTLQAPLLAGQTVLPLPDVPIGTSLMFFTQLFGGAIFVSVGQNLFNNYFIKGLAGVPGVDLSTILQQGATAITDIAEPTKGLVVIAYNEALRKIFITGLVMACLTFLGASGMEWKSVKNPAPKVDAESQSDGPAHEMRDSSVTETVDEKAGETQAVGGSTAEKH